MENANAEAHNNTLIDDVNLIVYIPDGGSNYRFSSGFGNSIENKFSTFNVEKQVHWPGPRTDSSKDAFKDVSGTDKSPYCLIEVVNNANTQPGSGNPLIHLEV